MPRDLRDLPHLSRKGRLDDDGLVGPPAVLKWRTGAERRERVAKRRKDIVCWK
jgi:hypothetical protein